MRAHAFGSKSEEENIMASKFKMDSTGSRCRGPDGKYAKRSLCKRRKS